MKREKGSYPLVTAVDESDSLVGYFDLYTALRAGYLRRTAAVLLFNEKGEILLQKRTTGVLSPNTWDFSAGGHVNEGDSYTKTAQQELFEELRLNIELQELCPPVRVPGMFIGLYKGLVDSNQQIEFNPEEVSAIRWITIPALEAEMETCPEQFCEVGLYNFWQLHRDKILAA